MPDRRRALMFHGIVLFLLGLLTGFVENQFANPRMGLAVHLEGLMNGTFLLALGAASSELRLSVRSGRLAYVGVLFGAYANWLTTILAAVFGTSALTPLAGEGHSGERWQEFLVTAGFTSVAVVVVSASIILLLGFRRRAVG